ncbi:MAG: DUF2306 domain-containing protein [Gemmatimonadota bacterium]
MTSTPSRWRLPAALTALTLVPALAGISRLVQLGGAGNVTPENARFFAAPLPVVLHIPAAIIFGMLGAFQFSADFRRRHRVWHRTAGRLLVACSLVVATTGLWMTLTYRWPRGDGIVVFAERLTFGIAMLLSVVLGVDAIRHRNFAAHGEWMIRAYAIGMGAGTQVLTHLPWFLFIDTAPGEGPRAVMMGLGWVLNVAVAECVIRRPKRGVRAALAAV